ncbi:M48 family metallopeptidase [Sphingobacterium endophyticum]|uniref:M48 family metallopeptidase n=1 Tax=Sphingobacterium endophyticum TaxID=2546448 RepID=UPI0012E10E43|nr:M48 family metallopeptidase [Sphingobacterium endophyticum]
MKILGKFLLLLGGIAVCYLLLLQVNWTTIFQVKENRDRLEERLGKVVLEQVKDMYDVIEDEDVNSTLDSIFIPLLKDNYISTKNYDLFLVKSVEVNAFALPDDKIIVTTGLINFLDSADYLSAVLAHEVAHCEKNHVMKSLITNFGLDLLLSGSGTGEVTNFVTGQAFSRKLEKEADEMAVEYLDAARINPTSISKVMDMFDVYLSSDDDVSWISSHPVPSDRKKYLSQKIDRLKTNPKMYKEALSSESWKSLKDRVSSSLDNES